MNKEIGKATAGYSRAAGLSSTPPAPNITIASDAIWYVVLTISTVANAAAD